MCLRVEEAAGERHVQPAVTGNWNELAPIREDDLVLTIGPVLEETLSFETEADIRMASLAITEQMTTSMFLPGLLEVTE